MGGRVRGPGRLRRVGDPPLPLSRDHVSSVGFVTTDDEPIGTCFVTVSADTEIPALYHGYVVTARHVLYSKRTGLRYPNLHVRFREYGGDRVQDLPAPDWVEHPVEDIDVAVAPISTTADFVIGALSLDIQGFQMTDIEPVLGQPVFYVGLFGPADRMGAEGVPMVRSGTLGAFAQMIHPDGSDAPFEAHLIDCRSYGGFSGSPVFLQEWLPSDMGNMLPFRDGINVVHRMGVSIYATWLLGVLIVHYTDQARPSEVSNVGVGIVVPIERVAEVLNDERFKAMREDERERERRKPGRNVKAEEVAREPYTRDDYLRDLIKVTQPTPQPDATT
jgi:hypothetical protein